MGWLLLIIFIMAFLGHSWLCFELLTKHTSFQHPLRFNRQRREMCFYDESIDIYHFIPWEKVKINADTIQALEGYLVGCLVFNFYSPQTKQNLSIYMEGCCI